MTFTDTQIAALKAPLDSNNVKKPSGRFGPKGDYLEGWHVINELNRIFGFDGWSYRIELMRDALTEGTDSNGNVQWQAAYTCICTLTVGDVIRQDVGFGSGFAKGIGDAVEGATKEAVTDALKRCARTFGNPFGLALYDKSRANVCDGPVEPSDPDDPLAGEFPNTSQGFRMLVRSLRQTMKEADRAKWIKDNQDTANNLNDAEYTMLATAIKIHKQTIKEVGQVGA